jgi:hypothetical protein
MMHDPSKSSERALVEAIRAIYSSHRERLRELKQEAIRTGAGPESLWEGLVRSAGTWGNASAGLKLMRTPGFHKQLGWRALAALGDRAREARMLAALKRAGCRWPNRKARFLANSWARLKEMGGPGAAKRKLDSVPGRDGKIKFLLQFQGVGQKYARNMMMDGYHPDFRDSIAIDIRITEVLRKLGLPSTYPDAERFLVSAAHKAGLEGWEADRLLFLYKDEVLGRLQATSGAKRMS